MSGRRRASLIIEEFATVLAMAVGVKRSLSRLRTVLQNDLF